MFEDTLEIVKDIQQKVDGILSVNYDEITQKNVDAVLRHVVQSMLIEFGTKAAISTREYSYPPLLEHLVENLSNPEHVIVKDGKVTKFFDEKIAGTAHDLYSGVEEAGGHTGTEIAPAIWKYGIYTPISFWKGGKGSRVFRNLPSYDEVISERLEAWGDKAPYWYLIEHGNAGGGREFPSVKPTNFIKNLSRAVKKAESAVIDVISLLTSEFVDAQVENILVGRQKKGTTVAIVRVDIPGIKLTKLRSSRGNTFYNLNGERSLTLSEVLPRLRALIGN